MTPIRAAPIPAIFLSALDALVAEALALEPVAEPELEPERDADADPVALLLLPPVPEVALDWTTAAS